MNKFAEALAMADEEEQGKFLNDFARALRHVCRTTDNRENWTNQVYYFAKHLNEATYEVLKETASTYEYLKEEAAKEKVVYESKRKELYELEREIAEKRRQLEQETGF